MLVTLFTSSSSYSTVTPCGARKNRKRTELSVVCIDTYKTTRTGKTKKESSNTQQHWHLAPMTREAVSHLQPRVKMPRYGEQTDGEREGGGHDSGRTWPVCKELGGGEGTGDGWTLASPPPPPSPQPPPCSHGSHSARHSQPSGVCAVVAVGGRSVRDAKKK
ncbi:hypothetical protein E2C01_011924 [Portunus trituberculatus]|uniref:Uncharacterized protein n=1 Tax=Portunus trituberculatus TaxID=210409 RepID=A0A5B7DCG9_PORTR|nr:hypothetical protein [Portunus trituberculatus]